MSYERLYKGDLVRIAADLGSAKSHFPTDRDAIVLASYADQFGGSNHHSYTVFLKGGGPCSWYERSHLTLVQSGRVDLLADWEKERADEITQKSDLDWIFANGPDVLERGDGASIQALANCFGLTNLWGPRGEGVTYYQNAGATLRAAAPFLVMHDKAGWLATCAKVASS